MAWDGIGWMECHGMAWDRMGWDGIGWMEWHGMAWDGMGWDGLAWHGMGRDGMFIPARGPQWPWGPGRGSGLVPRTRLQPG